MDETPDTEGISSATQALNLNGYIHNVDETVGSLADYEALYPEPFQHATEADTDTEEVMVEDSFLPNDEYPLLKWGKTIKGKLLLLIATSPEAVYTFSLHHDKANHFLWNCVGCRVEVQKRRRAGLSDLPSVFSLKQRKSDNSIDINDVVNYEHCCGETVRSLDYHENEQILREISQDMETSSKPAATAILEFDRRFNELCPHSQPIIRKRKSILKRLKRHRHHFEVGNVDPFNIPLDLQMSLVHDGGNVVRYFAKEGRPEIFMGDKYNMDILRECTDIIMDGTFSRAPNDTRQLYSIHAVYREGFQKQSAYLSAMLLLPDSTETTYVDNLRRLRSYMEECGGVRPQRFHIDAEDAVLNAIQSVFPESMVHLCYFHYTKALYDWLNTHSGHALKRHPKFKKFLLVLRGSVFLPPEVYRDTINDILASAPKVGKSLKAILAKFCYYYGNYWVRRADFINQCHNRGPRTTNQAEGYHRGLQTHFPENHPHIGLIVAHGRSLLQSHVQQYRREADGSDLQTRKQLYANSDIRIDKALTEFKARHQLGLVNLAEILQYARHQALNASPKQYNARLPDATYPNFAAMTLEENNDAESDEEMQSPQQRRRSGVGTRPRQRNQNQNQNQNQNPVPQHVGNSIATAPPVYVMSSQQFGGYNVQGNQFIIIPQPQQPIQTFMIPSSSTTTTYFVPSESAPRE